MNKKDKTNNKLQFLYVDTSKREGIEIVQQIEVMYNLKDKSSAE